MCSRARGAPPPSVALLLRGRGAHSGRAATPTALWWRGRVLVRERKSAIPDLLDQADGGHFHVARPEPPGIDPQGVAALAFGYAHNARYFLPETSCDTITGRTNAPP